MIGIHIDEATTIYKIDINTIRVRNIYSYMYHIVIKERNFHIIEYY